jgi:hypothetical protein
VSEAGARGYAVRCHNIEEEISSIELVESAKGYATGMATTE